LTQEIPLTRGYVALVDDEDFEWLTSGGKWSAGTSIRPDSVYARRTVWVSKEKCIAEWMHKLILPSAQQVDHINGNKLDNRRSNLRLATASQNAANRRHRADSRNRFKGIARTAGSGKPWLASITVAGEFFHLGVFDTDVEAARAYDAAAIKNFGEFARINFPQQRDNSGHL